jgi:hypothetical protein
MTDVIKEEVEAVAEVLTKSMGAGKWIKDFVKSKNPKFAGKSEEKRKEMALGAFYSNEEVERINEKLETETIKHPKGERPKGIGWVLKSAGEQTGKDHSVWERKFKRVGGVKEEVETVDEVTMRRTIPTKQERDAAKKYYANHSNALSAEKRRAGIENYPGREDPIIGNLKNTFKKNSEKDKAANEEVSLDEGRGRPPKPGSAAYKRRQSEGGGDSDTPGLHGQLIKHKSLQNAPPKIKFTNGEEAHISAEHRDRAIKHLEGMIGPGKNPQARDNAVEAMSRSHAGLMQAIGVESKPEEKKSAMSAQRDKPKLSLTKEESNMAQEDIVEKLQAALDAGILSQNDFDKLTQIDELSSNLLNRAKEATYAKLDKTDVNIYPTPNQLKKVQGLRKQGQKFKDAANAKTQSEEVEQLAESPSHLGYSGTVGKKEYTMTIPNKGDGLGDYSDKRLHKLITKQNPHLEHHEVSAIVDSGGDEESDQTVEHKGKTYTHKVVNYQEPRHLYSEEVEAVDEKTLSPKQKKIAAVAGHPDKIDAEDFKKLRKEETTAGVAAVVAALSRNLKELK